MARNRELLKKTAYDLICNAEKLHGHITGIIESLSQSGEDPDGQMRQTKTILSILAKFLQSQTERAKTSIAHHLCDIAAAQVRLDRDPDEEWPRLRMDQAEAFIAFNAAALRSQIRTVKESITEVAAEYAGINTNAISLLGITELESQVQTLDESASAIAENYLEQFEIAEASSNTIGKLTCLLFEVTQFPLYYRRIGWLGYIENIRSELDSAIVKVHCFQTSAEDDQVLLEKIANIRRRLAEEPPQ